MTDEAYEKKWGKGPHVTVDAVIFDGMNRVWLIQRKDGTWALPGGFVNPSERLSNAIVREVFEETNMTVQAAEFVRVYDDPLRDKRSHMITHVHYFIRTFPPYVIEAGSDAIDVKSWKFVDALQLPLFADHNQILLDAFLWRRTNK